MKLPPPGAFAPPYNAMAAYRDLRLADVLRCVPFKCQLRRMAWINSAGHEYAPSCIDVRGNLLLRDAVDGSSFAWDADHIIPGGPDQPWNLRALQRSINRSEGDSSSQ